MMKRVFVLAIVHEEDGIEDPKGVFSTKTKLKVALNRMKSDLGFEDLKEGQDYAVYEVPFNQA